MLYNKPELGHIAIDVANHWAIPPELVCAIIEVSSQWQVTIQEWEPEPWLLQQHPVDFPGGEREYLTLGTRWGLMQFMGSRLKQAGYKEEFSEQLLEPKVNINAGCMILRNCIGDGKRTNTAVLTNWYGAARRRMVAPTEAYLPLFRQFVAERPSRVAEKAAVGSDVILP